MCVCVCAQCVWYEVNITFSIVLCAFAYCPVFRSHFLPTTFLSIYDLVWIIRQLWNENLHEQDKTCIISTIIWTVCCCCCCCDYCFSAFCVFFRRFVCLFVCLWAGGPIVCYSVGWLTCTIHATNRPKIDCCVCWIVKWLCHINDMVSARQATHSQTVNIISLSLS